MHTPSFLNGRLVTGQRATLEPLRQTLARLGNPQNAFPAVLVSGTNGKGSTVTFLSHIVKAADMRVGTFVSPSLLDLRELVLVDGEMLEPSAFEQVCEKVLRAAGAEGLTLFELATAAAFLAFASAQVALAVIEVGMGGRSDATNLCHPVVSIITHVALDHTAELGATVQEIALEKVGIARAGHPMLTRASGLGLETIETACAAIDAPTKVLGKSFHASATLDDADVTLHFSSGAVELSGLKLGLLGRHQAQNAALALQAALELRAQGFVLPDEALRAGLAHARLPGRLERFHLRAGHTVWLDGAHNPDGMQSLMAALSELEGAGGLARPLVVVFAIFADKDVRSMLDVLLPHVDRIVCTQSGAARCMTPERLALRVRRWIHAHGRAVNCSAIGNVDAALALALQVANWTGTPGTVLVCGTLSLIVPARAALQRYSVTPQA